MPVSNILEVIGSNNLITKTINILLGEPADGWPLLFRT
jgi:hypothetical protein